MDNFFIQLNTLIPGFIENMSGGLVIFARIIGFMRLAPIFNRKEIPTLIKLSLAFLFTVMFVMLIHPKSIPADGDLLLAIMLNIAVGAMIGYMAQLILAAVDAGGDMINMQMGLSSAMVLDPTTSSQVSILGKFFGLIGIIIFLKIGGVYWLIQAFMRSFEIFPIYSSTVPLDRIVNMDYLISMSSNVLYMGLQIASPVLLATLGQDIILGVISKTAPQVNVFQLSFLFKPVFGAAILTWILPMLVNVISDYFMSFSHII
ncbi:flagellar biosynthetic protein FliR [bacterium]|nr:flagellar biosynthetic protein FliR [bacterium]